MMHGPEKSDPGIVAMKPANEAGRPAEERVERRAGTKGNADRRTTRRTQGRERVHEALARVREAAKLRKRKIRHPWPSDRFAATHPRWEPYAGCVRGSWYEPASASLARPKPSKQDGSESYGRHGNVGSGA